MHEDAQEVVGNACDDDSLVGSCSNDVMDNAVDLNVEEGGDYSVADYLDAYDHE